MTHTIVLFCVFIYFYVPHIVNGCNINEFECKSNQLCISINQVQDGIYDCPDGSDELCRPDQYRCLCGFPRCIDNELIGNGFVDCQDGSDEGRPHPCNDTKSRARLSGDDVIQLNITPTNESPNKLHSRQLLNESTKHTKLLNEESFESTIHSSQNRQISQSDAFGSLSSGQVSPTPTNQILVSKQLIDKLSKNIAVHANSRYRQLDNSIVELTRTYEPYEPFTYAFTPLPTISALSANHFYTIERSITDEPVVEITGTFIPEVPSIVSSFLPSFATTSTNDSTAYNELPENSMESNLAIKDNQTVTGTKETLVTDETTFNLITGTYERQTSYFVDRQLNSALTQLSVTGRKVADEGVSILTDQFIVPNIVHNTEMFTQTIGVAHKHNQQFNFNKNMLQELRRETIPTPHLELETLMKKVPVYIPSTVESLTTKKTLANPENKITERTTIFGFIDFSTVINGTEVIFMPSTTSVLPKSINKIQSKISSSSRPQTTTSRQNLQTKTQIMPLFLSTTREFLSHNFKTITAIKPLISSSMVNSMPTTKVLIQSTPTFRREQTERSIELININKVKNSRVESISAKESLSDKIYGSVYSELLSENIKTSATSATTTTTSGASNEYAMSSSMSSSMEPSFSSFSSLTTPRMQFSLPIGLLSSITGTDEIRGTITEWTTSVFGTYIRGTYAHILQSTSSIYPKPKSKPIASTADNEMSAAFKANTLLKESIKIEPTKTIEILTLQKNSDLVEGNKLNLKQSLENNLNTNNVVSPVLVESSNKIDSGMTETQPYFAEASYSTLQSAPISGLMSQNRVTITSGFILPTDYEVDREVAEDRLHPSVVQNGKPKRITDPLQALEATSRLSIIADQLSQLRSIQEVLITYYTTYTYFTTYFRGGSTLINSRLETVTNIETSTVQSEIKPTSVYTTSVKNSETTIDSHRENNTMIAAERDQIDAIQATNTRKPIVVTRTRTAGNGFTPIPSPSGSRRPVVIVRRRPDLMPKNAGIAGQSENKTQSNRMHIRSDTVGEHIDHHHSTQPLVNRFASGITPTPVTFYTTYTYFTTELSNGRPVVRSREQIYSTVISNKILPTRTIPSGAYIRQKRTLLEKDGIEWSQYQTASSLPFINYSNRVDRHYISHTENLDNQKPLESSLQIESKEFFPTGIISERSEIKFINESPQTLVTELYGTFINGFYAQFAITKTKSSQLDLTESQTNTVSTETNFMQLSNAEFAENTETIPTKIFDFNFETNLENTLKEETNEEINDNSSNVNLEALTVVDLDKTNKSRSFDSSLVSSFESNTSFTQSVTPLLSKTGLITSIVETKLNSFDTTLITSEIYGTYINGVYAHLAKTRMQTLSNSPSSASPQTFFSTLTPFTTSADTNKSLVAVPTGVVSYKYPHLNQSAPVLPLHSSMTINERIVHIITNSKTSQSDHESLQSLLNIDNNRSLSTSYNNSLFLQSSPNNDKRETTNSLSYVMENDETLSDIDISNTLSTTTDNSVNADSVSDNGINITQSSIINSEFMNAEKASDNNISETATASDTLMHINAMPDDSTTITMSTTNDYLIKVQTLPDLGITRTLSTTINDSKTTIYTTDIKATNISGLMAHIAQVSSTIIEPWSPLPGLASISMSTDILNDIITLYTTEFYTTDINGLTAYYSRSTSNIIDFINKNQTSNIAISKTSFKRIHFPTPVRARHSSKFETISPTSTLTATITTTVTSTISYDDNIEHIKNNPDFRDLQDYDENYTDEYYDESEHSEEHTPRSRPIREKDSEPLVEYDSDYVDSPQPSNDNLQPQNHVIPFRGFNSRPDIVLQNNNRNNVRVPTSTQPTNVLSNRRNSGGGFGQRVGVGQVNADANAHSAQRPRHGIVRDVNTQEFNTQALTTSRPISRRVMSKVTRMRQLMTRSSIIVPTNSYDYETDTTVPNNRHNPPENRQYERRQYRKRLTTTTTTSTTPSPRLVLPNRRRFNRKNILRSRFGTNYSARDSEETHTRSRNENSGRRRNGQRGRTAKTTVLFLNKQSFTRTPEYALPTKEVISTPELPKIPITVTSIVTTVKTIPIFHGFKTSYATLTTTTLNSSVIETSQYETTVNPTDGITKTVFTRFSDSIEPSKVFEVVVTTTILKEIKLVPIRIGFSTRTETITDIRTFTELATLTTINPVFIGGEQYLPPTSGLPFTLFTTINTFVSTQTLSKSTVLSIQLRGKTLLSTLTLTTLSETTITATQTIRVPITQAIAPQIAVHPHPITTLLTLSLTGDGGDITELVTEVTVPIFHTKVERDVKATKSVLSQQTLMPSYALTADTIEYISASFKTVDQLQPIDTFFIKTIFKGSATEIYEASATQVENDNLNVVHNSGVDDHKYDHKYATNFKKRKLQQFDDNLGYAFIPQPIRYKELNRAPTRFNPKVHSLLQESNEPIPDFIEIENPSRLQSVPQSAPDRNAIHGRKPTFQRIRINKLSTAQPYQPIQLPILPSSQLIPLSSPNEPSAVRFHRIAGVQRLPEANTPIRVAPQPGFRRVPVFNNQLPALQTIRSTLVEPTSTIEAEQLLPTVAPSNEERRQTFRRVRPVQSGQNGRRLKVSSRPVVPTPTSFIFESSTDTAFSPIFDIEDIPRRKVVTRKPVLDNEPLVTNSDTATTIDLKKDISSATTEEPKRVIRIRRPNTSANNSRKKVILRGKPEKNDLLARGPVLANDDEPSRNNALDSDETISSGYGTRIVENYSTDKLLSTAVNTPVIPLTYYTTFTYMTTVVRGQHTAHLSRESVTSTVANQALDKTIVNLIQSSDGYINPTSVADLGTKTKGVTTTIINLKSRIQLFNEDLYKVIQSTKSILITPTSVESIANTNANTDIASLDSSNADKNKISSVPTYKVESVPVLKVANLESIPKKHLTYFTYYYTLSDPHTTKYSTRAELVSSEPAFGQSLSTLKLDTTINSDGLLSIGSGPETIKLGSRELAGTTTEVNLALNTFVRFDGISNVKVEPVVPTLYEFVSKPTSPLPSSALEATQLSGSFSTATISDQLLTTSTPEIPLETELKLQSHTRKPVKLFSSAVIRDPLRSKFDSFNGRPGLRVRVRPVTDSKFSLAKSSTLVDNISTSWSVLPTESESVISPTPTLDSSSVESSHLENESFKVKDSSKLVTPTKKRIAVTLRRPFSGNNRVSSRLATETPTSTKPRFVVVTRTGSVGSAKSSASRLRVSSRVYKSPTLSIEPTLSPSIDYIRPTYTIDEIGQTVSLSTTVVPIIFGLETSYRTLTFTSTLKTDSSSRTSSSSAHTPTSAIVTYFTTTTHTVPFTVGGHTIYTTVEETNSRITTEVLEAVDASDAARANRFTKISDGVTLIVASNADSTPYTLQPTLVTGAAVHMKDGITSDTSSSTSSSVSLATLFDTRTLFTTFTYFTTFYTDDTSVISSSEQTMSNVVTIPYTHVMPTTTSKTESRDISPTVVLETSDRLRTSTLYSTQTYYATLFNGSTSTITPIEEIKTELFTIREPITITRTIRPTSVIQSESPSLFTRTYYTTYTNLVTFFHNHRPVTSTIEETVTSEVIYTLPYLSSSKYVQITPSSSLISPTATHSPILTTRSTYTTLTHFITLFSGSQTILSSIEEISPTVVTEVSGYTSELTSDRVANVKYTQESAVIQKQSKDLFAALAASVSTLFTTHTYFTTLFSGTTSTILSRKETTSSLVTLYVPHSAIRSSPTTDLNMQTLSDSISIFDYMEITPTVTYSDGHTMSSVETDGASPRQSTDIDAKASSSVRAIQPSLRIHSSKYGVLESQLISRVFEDLRSSEGITEEQLSSVVAEVGGSTTIIDGSTIVLFTDFILPTQVPASEVTETLSSEVKNIAKGPAGDLVSSLLNHADISLLNDLFSTHIDKMQASSVRDTLSPVYIAPDPSHSLSETSSLKPGSIIELSDLLDGANLAGNIGEAIKDIVHILAKSPKSKNSTSSSTDRVERIGAKDILPPREGMAVSNSQDPVYIPLGDVLRPSVTDFTPSISTSATKMNEIHATRSRPDSASTSRVGPTTPSHYYIDNFPIEPSLETSRPVSHSTSRETQKPTPKLSSERVLQSSQLPKTAISRVSSGATTIFFTDTAQKAIFSNLDSEARKPAVETRYVTSVESITKTLTLTTTKVYYTRDSPLTITSVLITTIPPRTFVSTIIGSRTILGTATDSQSESIQATQTQMSTTVTTTTLIYNSITTTVVRTLVVPTAIQPTKSAASLETKSANARPSRKPGQGSYRPPTRGPTETPSLKTSAPRSRVPYTPGKPNFTRPHFEGAVTSPSPTKRPTISPTYKTTRASILDFDQCKPACNAANKEICNEADGKYKCECRHGFVKRGGDSKCLEMQNYVVIVRVMKVGESDVTWFAEFNNNKSNEYLNLAKMTKEQIDSAYMSTDIKDNYIGANVFGIDKVTDGGHGVFVNLTVHLTKRSDLDEDLLREELIKTLEQSSEALPNPQYISADVEDVIDFDECSSDQFNDCSPSAKCVNEAGSYRCECRDGYPDMDLSLPGRVCASEIKSCEYCQGRGDCVRDSTGQFTSCKCHRMYLGRKCEINGLLLATLLPIAAILCIISICCIVYCCRKWRKRTISKGFRNLSSFGPTVIGGTLDRKAMLETSSESSDHLRAHVYDAGILPSDPNESTHQRRRESEPSLDRSMGSMGGAFNSLPPQIVIPRARHSPHQDCYSPQINSIKHFAYHNVKNDGSHACDKKLTNLEIEKSANTFKRLRIYDKNRSSKSTKYSQNANFSENGVSIVASDDNKSIISSYHPPSSLTDKNIIAGLSSNLLRNRYMWETLDCANNTLFSGVNNQFGSFKNPHLEVDNSTDIAFRQKSNPRNYKNFLSEESNISNESRHKFHNRNAFSNDCFSLGSTMTSRQQSFFGANNIGLFYDD